jgi:hypothetical protein
MLSSLWAVLGQLLEACMQGQQLGPGLYSVSGLQKIWVQ